MLSKSLLLVALFALVIHVTLVAFTLTLGGRESPILAGWKSFLAFLSLIAASSGRGIKMTTILAGGTVAAMVHLQWHPDLPKTLFTNVIPQIGPLMTSILASKNINDAFGMMLGVSLMFGDVLFSALDITASVVLFGFLVRALLLHRSARAKVNNKIAATASKMKKIN